MPAAARLLVTLATLACLGAAGLSAQRTQMREGFWIGFGLGGGSAGQSCNLVCDSLSRQTGFSGYLKIGGTLSPKILLGGESSGWTKSESGTTVRLGNLSAAVYFYPAPATGFFLKGGPGFSVYSADDGTDKESGTGFGFTLGAGYDIRVSRNISITPVANFLWGSIGDVKSGDLSTQGLGLKQTVFDFQLGITFH
jgi:opacity protein-like surface antigen